MPLEEEADLYTLLDELRPVIFDWRDLGLGLGVAGYVLDTYKSKEPKDAMMDMLTHALRNLELEWIKIVRVLMKINPNLAKNLRSRYCPNEQIEENVDGPSEPKKRKTQLFQYPMPGPLHGQALIINIVNYDHPMSKRTGSNKDKVALEKALKTLGYEVKSVDDLLGDDIIASVIEHANKAKNPDSFICCILAHGGKGVVYGKDKKPVEIAKIARELVNESNPCCKYLHSKPKIFFIQACQGSDLPRSTVDDSADDMVPISPSSLPLETADTGVPPLPRDSDFFYGFASSFETKATRNELEGSSYIKELCNVLETNHHDNDLMTMVTMVHFEEAQRFHRLKNESNLYQQQPQIVSTLRGQVKF